MVSRTASPAAQATGLPPKVVPCWPGCSSSAAAAEGDGGAERQAAAEALGEGDDVRHDALVGLVLEPVPGAADAGLDLVEDEQGAGGGGDLPGGLEVAGGRDDDAVLALDRLDDDEARSPR